MSECVFSKVFIIIESQVSLFLKRFIAFDASALPCQEARTKVTFDT